MNFNPTFSDNDNKINVKLNTSNQSVNVGSQNYTMAKNYELLTNKPSINEVELIGDKSSEDLHLQDELISGQNIKTINNESLLGSGNITINPSDIYWCNANTTYYDVQAALSNNKIPARKIYHSSYGDLILFYSSSSTDEYEFYFDFSCTTDNKIFTLKLDTHDTWSNVTVTETNDITVIPHNSQDSLLWINLDTSKPVFVKKSNGLLYSCIDYNGSSENATFAYIDSDAKTHILVVDWSEHSTVSWTETTKVFEELYICSPSSGGTGTTFTEISQALTNGKIPVVKMSGIWYAFYTSTDSNYHYFHCCERNRFGSLLINCTKCEKTTNIWSSDSYALQEKLVSNSNIKTINNQSLLGAGNISISVPTKTSQLTNDGSDNTSVYVEADELATVATSGSYDDLLNKPTIPAAQVNSDWDAISGVAQILNKPNLATVATSGSYNDLTDTPTIPVGIPAGGNAGQVLSKISATDYDVHWTNQTVTYPSGYCTTSGSNQKKVINCSLWTATANTYLHILIGQANTYVGEIRFNVNSTGDVPVYINGTISSATNYSMPAGTYIIFYDGTYFYLRTDGVIPNTQPTLVSGTNIKTINNTSLLGSGDIVTKELFECTYGTTTHAEVEQALSDGKLPICIYNYGGADGLYTLQTASGTFVFETRTGTNATLTLMLRADDTWTRYSTTYQDISYRVTSISSASTNTQYPSAKCVYDAIQGGGGGTSLVTETVTLLSASWIASGSGYEQSVSTINDSNTYDTVWVSPKTDGVIDYMSDYVNNGIYCKSSGYLYLTFYASSIPSQDIVVNVTMG